MVSAQHELGVDLATEVADQDRAVERERARRQGRLDRVPSDIAPAGVAWQLVPLAQALVQQIPLAIDDERSAVGGTRATVDDLGEEPAEVGRQRQLQRLLEGAQFGRGARRAQAVEVVLGAEHVAVAVDGGQLAQLGVDALDLVGEVAVELAQFRLDQDVFGKEWPLARQGSCSSRARVPRPGLAVGQVMVHAEFDMGEVHVGVGTHHTGSRRPRRMSPGRSHQPAARSSTALSEEATTARESTSTSTDSGPSAAMVSHAAWRAGAVSATGRQRAAEARSRVEPSRAANTTAPPSPPSSVIATLKPSTITRRPRNSSTRRRARASRSRSEQARRSRAARSRDTNRHLSATRPAAAPRP